MTKGTIVSTKKGLIDHVGILTKGSSFFNNTVISNSGKYGMVIEEPLENFANGNSIKVVGYPGKKSPNEVLTEARSLLGDKYNLFKNNCEHFVRKVHGVNVESPQLFLYGMSIIGALILYLIFRR